MSSSIGREVEKEETFQRNQTDVWYDCLNLNGLIGQIPQPVGPCVAVVFGQEKK